MASREFSGAGGPIGRPLVANWRGAPDASGFRSHRAHATHLRPRHSYFLTAKTVPQPKFLRFVLQLLLLPPLSVVP
jgi:hypothetical protein